MVQLITVSAELLQKTPPPLESAWLPAIVQLVKLGEEFSQ